MRIEIIRTDGTKSEVHINKRGAIATIYKLIGCENGDAVNLHDGRVMIVDDDGWECQTVDHGNGHVELKPIRPRDGKSINYHATALYWGICRPGTKHQIVGDVAIATDEDFA